MNDPHEAESIPEIQRNSIANPTPIHDGQQVQQTCGSSSANKTQVLQPKKYFDGKIALALKSPYDVCLGEPLTGLDVVISNEGDETLAVLYGGGDPTFEVVTGNGDLIWSSVRAGLSPASLKEVAVAPGESISLLADAGGDGAQWDLRDGQGFPVDPGEYAIRGVLTVVPNGQFGLQSEMRLETDLHTVAVEEAPLPDYARPIEVDLIAPSEVPTGESVPFDLQISNTGDEPLVLWWSGDNVLPHPYYTDVVVFSDDMPIWRLSSAKGFGHGHLTLDSGESVSLSDITLSTSSNYQDPDGPWLWDQRGDCGTHDFRPCENAVEPGTYTVRAVVNVSPPETMEQESPFTPERTAIAIEPRELVITH